MKLSRSQAGKLGWEKCKDELRAWSAKQHAEAEARYTPVACRNCGSLIPYEKKGNQFCSRSCAAKVTNRLYPKRVQLHTDSHIQEIARTYVPRQCRECGTKIHSSYRFCGAECRSKNKWRLLEEELAKTGAYPSDSTAKRHLVHKHGHRCSKCGLEEWLGAKIPMVLDHINGNASDRTASNYQLLCPNCDSQTPTWKGRNRGNGRHVRRKRYRDGLSY